MSAAQTTTTPGLTVRLAQAAWITFVTLSIGLYVLGGIVYFRDLETICTASKLECHDRELAMPEDVVQLQAEGVTLRDWAIANTAYRVVISSFFWTVGFLIFARKRNEWNGLLFSLFLISFGTISGNQPALIANYPAIALLVKIVTYAGYVTLALFFATFPNGRIVPRVMWIPLALWSLNFFLDLFVGWIPRSSSLWDIMAATTWLGMFGSGAAAQAYRYLRVSNEQERRQTKWVVFGIAVLVTSILIVFFSPLGSQFGTNVTYSRRSLAVLIGFNLLFTIIPLTIGIAILRYQLFDIDVIIRRTLVYSILTLILGLIYIGCIVVSRTLVAPLVGGSEVAIVASTLAIAALFMPLRRRIQNLIDKRFYRRKYDAAKVLAAFGVTARDETDLDALTGEMLRVVDETVQPEFVGLWLRDQEKEVPRQA
jgi:hypothetical protein